MNCLNLCGVVCACLYILMHIQVWQDDLSYFQREIWPLKVKIHCFRVIVSDYLGDSCVKCALVHIGYTHKNIYTFSHYLT